MTIDKILSGKLGLGWNPENENFGYLAAPQPLVMSAPADAPLVVDPSAWIPVKNQGGMGSCEGHANSTIGEYLNVLKTAGEYVRLSPMWTYLQSQKMGGNFGSDSGAQIAAGVEASKRKGYCREETFPYPGRYSTRIPPGAEAEAAQHTVQQHTPMRSADDCFSFLSNLLGGILLGINWTEDLANSNGYITIDNCGARRGDRVLGGHALCLLGYRFDENTSETWFKMWNSHGREWGLDGRAWVHSRAVEHWIQTSQFGAFVGLSDMAEYERRVLDISLAA